MTTLSDPLGPAKSARLEKWYRAGVGADAKLLPPVQACINPTHGCNLECIGCEYEVKQPVIMGKKHAGELVQWLVEWGVKNVTFGIVGEATQYDGLADALVIAAGLKVDTTLITNGVLLTEEIRDAVVSACSTVWFKIPAASPMVYKETTHRSLYGRVIANVRELMKAKMGMGMKVGWRYDISVMNMGEAVEACRVAKGEGFDWFHARMVPNGCTGNRGSAEELTQGIGVDTLQEIEAKCGEMEGVRFGVRVETERKKAGFHQCYAALLAIHLGAEGNIYFCRDRYGDQSTVVGRHTTLAAIKKAWGGEKYMELLRDDTPHWCDSDCDLKEYHQMARVLAWEERDPMREWQILH